MVSLPTLSTIALLIASGVVAAPWNPTSKHHTHRARGLGPTGLQLTSYHPPSVFKGYGTEGISRPSSDNMAKEWLQEALGVAPDGLVRHSGYSQDGVEYSYFHQVLNGISIANAVANVAIKDRKVLSYGASFIHPQKVDTATPVLPATAAILKAEALLGGKYNDWPTTLEYVAKDNDHVVLTHVIQVQNPSDGQWKQAYIDANNGELANVVDFVADASYRAVRLDNQDPRQGIEDVKDPQDRDASPNGWHQIKDEHFAYTAGNNVISYKVDPVIGSSHQTGSNDNYTYTYDPNKQPINYPNPGAALVNAFYVANSIHDLTYRYGFTEAAYNFQSDNMGKGGKGNDRVKISVQDSTGVNNANFATPADGQSGQMRMFLWTMTTPTRDGALENDIVVHEFTHGVSNRMTGGGTGSCLQTTEAGGMGEGWSDAMADITEVTSNPKTSKDFTLGSYVTDNPNGIRKYPYSTNSSINPLRYSDVKTNTEVHAIGEVWANMLHNVLVMFMDKHGPATREQLRDPSNKYGQNMLLRLMVRAFQLQPCNPTFVSARDAIIQADAILYGSENKCSLWKVFASRGLGVDAANYVDSSKVPDGC